MPLISKDKSEKAKEGTGKAWGGTKSFAGRTKQKVLAATGRAEQTVDIEFEFEDDTFNYHKALLEELVADAKRYYDAANDFGQVQRKLADQVVDLYEASASMYNAALQYQTFGVELEKSMKDMKESWKKEFQEPLEEYLEQYNELDKRISTRETRRVDMDRFFREYIQALEHPSHDPRRVVAKKDTYEQALEAYTALNDEVLTDMKALYNDRHNFLLPLFARLVHTQESIMLELQTQLKSVAALLPRSKDQGTNGKGAESFITPDDSSAAQHGTDYAQFADAKYSISGGDAAADESSEDSGEKRAEALLAASKTRAGGRVVEAPVPAKKKPAAPLPPKSKAVTATALFDFPGTEDDELPFAKGDILEILEQDGDWWEAKLNGKTGSIPANYVKLR